MTEREHRLNQKWYMYRLWKSGGGHATRKLGHSTTTTKWDCVLPESVGTSYFSTFVFEGEWMKLAFVKTFSVLEILYILPYLISTTILQGNTIFPFHQSGNWNSETPNVGPKFTQLDCTQMYVNSQSPSSLILPRGLQGWVIWRKGDPSQVAHQRIVHQDVLTALGTTLGG